MCNNKHDWYEQLVSRNWGFIPGDAQERLHNSRVLLAGCGLGCNIGRDLAAMGVGNFIAIDGDVVEVSNLNRQGYSKQHLGKEKATSTAKIIKGVNEDARVEVVNKYIENIEEIRPLIERSDFIFNTVDYRTSVFLSLNEVAQAMGKTVFFPTNIGWGSVIMVFDQDSMTMAEYLRVNPDAKCDLSTFLMRIAQDYLPNHLKSLYRNIAEHDEGTWASVPQVMPGAQLVSAMVGTLIVKKLAGFKIKTSPSFYAIDLWTGGVHNVAA